MDNKQKRWFETLPGILTGIAAIIGAIATLYVALDKKQETQQVPKVEQKTSDSTYPSVPSNEVKPLNAPQAQQQPPPQINLSSTWHELYPNPSNISQTTHDGDIFKFIIQGSTQGLRYQSTGSGTIKGQYIESTYQSTIPSTGRCAGTVSSDGMQIKLTCVDSVSGRYETAWVRE